MYFIRTMGVITMYTGRYKRILINNISINAHTTTINSEDCTIAFKILYIQLAISEITSIAIIPDILSYPAKYKSSGFICV
jgi:hypothetical protein